MTASQLLANSIYLSVKDHSVVDKLIACLSNQKFEFSDEFERLGHQSINQSINQKRE